LTAGGESRAGIDATGSDFGLANGDYLVAAAVVAAVCGLVLVLGLARNPGLKPLLGLGALVGGIGVCAVETAAYMKMNDYVTLGSGLDVGTVAIGMGIYVGAAAGVVAALGGLMTLLSKR